MEIEMEKYIQIIEAAWLKDINSLQDSSRYKELVVSTIHEINCMIYEPEPYRFNKYW